MSHRVLAIAFVLLPVTTPFPQSHNAASHPREVYRSSARPSYRSSPRFPVPALVHATRPRGRLVVPSDMVHVYDGDTLYVGSQAFRLRGVDTPELGQPRAWEARRRLIELVRAGPVTIVRRAQDVYGRIVADVFVAGRDVAAVLRDEGFAKPLPRLGGERRDRLSGR